MDFKAGDKIFVKVDGEECETVIDDHGTQRFTANSAIRYLVDSRQVDLNRMAIDCQEEKFDRRDYMRFYMMLGYSVCGFRDIFAEADIENPLRDKEGRTKREFSFA